MPFQIDFEDRDERGLLLEFVERSRLFLWGLISSRAVRDEKMQSVSADFPIRFEGLDPEDGKPADDSIKAPINLLRVYYEHGATAFSQLATAILRAPIEKLKEAGLTGEAFHAKLFSLKSWGARLMRSNLATEFYAALRHVMNIMNSLIGSLVDVTGLGEAAKEFKDLIENFIDYGLEPKAPPQAP